MNTHVAERLARGRAALGTWVTLGDVAITEIAARSGMDWLAVDLEHSTLGDREFEAHARVASLSGVACLARIPAVEPHRMKRLLDAGASGFIVANVTHRSQLDAAREAMNYPPHGRRGVGLGRAHHYGPGFQAYVASHRQALLVAQIEHVEALLHLKSILSHPGLDAWMIGPYDLSASLGHPGDFDHPEVLAALNEIQREGRNHRAAPGYHVVEPDVAELSARLDDGYRFVAYTVDFRTLDAAFRSGVNTLKQHALAPAGDGSPNGEKPHR